MAEAAVVPVLSNDGPSLLRSQVLRWHPRPCAAVSYTTVLL